MHTYDDRTIEIRLVGEKLSAQTGSARDAGHLIAAVEQMLAALVLRGKAAPTPPKGTIVVGLAAIEQGSYILRFTTPDPVRVMPAYRKLSEAIRKADFAELPAKSVEGLREIRTIARKYRARAEFWQRDGRRAHLATITSRTSIPIHAPEPPHIQEYPTLYGTVLRVGGDRPPRAQSVFFPVRSSNAASRNATSCASHVRWDNACTKRSGCEAKHAGTQKAEKYSTSALMRFSTFNRPSLRTSYKRCVSVWAHITSE